MDRPERPAPPFISFLTDFGSDSAPAVCRGVMWAICPDARILDIGHTVAKFAIRDGAFLLDCALPYLPVGVHLAVVDPGVGTSRRPLALRAARGDVLLGPDNGLLAPAARRLGGIESARILENPELWRPEVSSTFHGRDIFAPVAAHLACGAGFDTIGPEIPPSEIVDLVLPVAAPARGGLDSAVLFVDSFGNCRVAGQAADLESLTGALRPGDRFRVLLPHRELSVPWATTFGDVAAGEPLLYEDADYAGLALGINQGSAAEHFGLARDTPVRIEPA
ncbi:MAG: SAM hydrolase/SAM-dependent halogenase family protein [Candidatus Limnocylindria bacterium]